SNQRSSRGSGNRQSMGEGSLCWRGITESPPLGATPGAQNNNNSPGGWGNRGKTGGGTEGQVRGAETDSGTLEDLGHGAMANSGTLEDLGHGALEQKPTMFDSEEPGTMAEQAEQGAMAGQTEQTGAKIPTVKQMTSIAEQRVHDWPPWP
ncbi:hypothetical protein M9458_050922, partial [Cirrhinus mrigala]